MSFATRSCRISTSVQQVDIFPELTFDSSESCMVKAIVMVRTIERQETIKHQNRVLFRTKGVLDWTLGSSLFQVRCYWRKSWVY